MEMAAKRPRSVFRFSLKSLLMMFVPISVGLGGLRYATAAWASATVTFELLAILAAIIATTYGASLWRPIWGGFVVFSGGYLLLISLAPENGLVDILGTTKASCYLLDNIHRGADTTRGHGFLINGFQPRYYTYVPSKRETATDQDFAIGDNFLQISQSLWALTLGFLGACIAKCVGTDSCQKLP